MAIDNANRFIYLRSEFKFGFWDGLVAPTAFYGPINFTKLEITTPKQNMERLLSNMLHNHGTLLDSQPATTDPAVISCEFDSMSGNMLALLLGADTADLTQTASAVIGETITPVVGVWSKFANQHIAPDGTGTEIEFNTATPTLIPISNYEIDVVNGMFKPLNSLAATAVTVDYFKAARTGEIYNAGNALNKHIQLIGTAQERATAKMCSIHIYKASLTPSGTFDPVSNAYLKGGLEGDLLLPAGFTSPWRFEYTNLSA
jgi:hypothetical protein